MDKGQGLPITTIVIAALALVVLVILFAITTGRLAIFTGAASECGGVCVVDAAPTGVSAFTAGALEWPNNPASRNQSICAAAYEQKVQGKYIARGVRGAEDKPITCKVCCLPTAY